MSFILHSFNLPCRDINAQASFLSYLLDLEIRLDKEEKFIILNGARINLVEDFLNRETIIPAIELSAADRQSLKDFQQKLELYSYKTPQYSSKYKLSDDSLEFHDPSGNLWRIRLETFSHAGDHKNLTVM